jgi:hypothetical protein
MSARLGARNCSKPPFCCSCPLLLLIKKIYVPAETEVTDLEPMSEARL